MGKIKLYSFVVVLFLLLALVLCIWVFFLSGCCLMSFCHLFYYRPDGYVFGFGELSCHNSGKYRGYLLVVRIVSVFACPFGYRIATWPGATETAKYPMFKKGKRNKYTHIPCMCVCVLCVYCSV